MSDSTRTFLLSIGILVVSAGCHGPLAVPMVSRLGPEEQEQVEQSWDNMLMPADRLDRTLLLDTIIVLELHTRGVDRLRMTSEKFIDGAMVRMEVIFDRDNPDGDAFVLSVLDDDGNELRYESYSSDEITYRISELFGPKMTSDDLEGKLVVDEEAEAARMARLEEIRAATQPAFDP
jgi:hypothetical protein